MQDIRKVWLQGGGGSYEKVYKKERWYDIMAVPFKSNLTGFNVEGLSKRASGCLDLFLDTLKTHYMAPKWVESNRIEEL